MSATIDTLRAIGSVLAPIAFLGVAAWAYSGKRKADFDAAAQLPFADDDLPLADRKNFDDRNPRGEN